MELRAHFGSLIRSRRHRLGISQEELAGRAGLHRTYVADIERGSRNPTLQSIEKIARALNVSLAGLFATLTLDPSPEAEADGPQEQPLETLVDILLVEDNHADAELTMRSLRRAQLSNRVHVVDSGEAALDYVYGHGVYAQRLTIHRPRVMFLDLNLPGISGRDVLRRIKGDERSRSIPVVMLTMSEKAEDTRLCRNLGADAYLVKPFDFQRLCEVAPQLNFWWALCDAGPRGGAADATRATARA